MVIRHMNQIKIITQFDAVDAVGAAAGVAQANEKWRTMIHRSIRKAYAVMETWKCSICMG